MWSTHHPSCTHDIQKEIECPKVSLGQLSPTSLRDPLQAYVKQRESKKIKERRIKERKRGPGVKLESKGKMNKKYIYIYTHTIGVLSWTEIYRWAWAFFLLHQTTNKRDLVGMAILCVKLCKIICAINEQYYKHFYNIFTKHCGFLFLDGTQVYWWQGILGL